MKLLDCEQGSDEWHAARCGLPTVSEFSRFITPSRGDYSKQSQGYIADLIVESIEGPPEHVSSYWMDRGTSYEAEARSFYEFQRDCTVEEVGLVINRGAGWSPDGIPEGGGLEIKCPKPSTHVQWLLAGNLPDEHKPQCHGALVVGELEWIDFLSYAPGFRPLLIRVTPDDYTKKVEAALARFLEDYEKAKKWVMS